MEYLREKLKADLGISDEQYDALVRQARAESTVKNDIDNIGQISTLQASVVNDMAQMSAVQAQVMGQVGQMSAAQAQVLNDMGQQMAMILMKIMQLEAKIQ